MPNLKISELNRAKRLSDDAIIVVVQDNANKTVTIKELGDKINNEQNHLINKLYNEIKESTQGGNYVKLKNVIAKHEYRLNNINRELKSQSKCIMHNGELAEQAKKNAIHAINIAEKSNEESRLTRKGLAFVNSKVDNAIKDIKVMSTYLSYLGEYIDKTKDNLMINENYIKDYVDSKISENIEHAINNWLNNKLNTK